MASTAFTGTDREDNKSVVTGTAFGGAKSIGFAAGICLIINNITGPGVPSIANVFMEAGWLLPTALFTIVWLMSTISTGMYCEAMRMIPGNEHFKGRIEYTTIVKHYFGAKFFRLSQVGLNGALQSLNIISVVQSAQLMDAAISAVFGKSCGFNLTPFGLTYHDDDGSVYHLDEATKFWSCVDLNDVSEGNAWGCHCILSMGYLFSLFLTLPMGRWNLDDNIGIQVGAFILTILCWGVWFVVAFWSRNFTEDNWTIPAISDSSKDYSSQAAVLGAVLFNFGYVTTIPSWVNEKRPDISVNKSVWISSFASNVVFFALGVSGCMAFWQFLEGPATGNCAKVPGVDEACASSVLNIFTTDGLMKYYMPAVHNNKAANFVVQLSVYLFPIGAVLSGIPVFSIVVKYNCIENGLSKAFSDFWGVYFPWLIAIPLLYQPDALNQFITFSSLVFVSFTDFIVPWYLYYYLMCRQEAKEKQRTSGEIEDGAEEDTEYDALVHDKDINNSIVSAMSTLIPVHWAFPPEWGLSVHFKKTAALVLVYVMAVASIGSVVISVVTSASNTWDCAAVSA